MTDRDVQPGIEPGIFSTPAREPDDQTRRTAERDPMADLRDARAAVDAIARQSAFADALRESRVIGAHPDTLERIRAERGAHESLRGVRLVPMTWAERGQIYTGAALAEIADLQDELDETRAEAREVE